MAPTDPPAPRPAVRPLRFAELLAAVGLPPPYRGNRAGPLISGVTLDSRDIQPGDLYAALPGHITHGARFADAAVAGGAAAILTDPPGRPWCGSLSVPMVVVDEPRVLLPRIAAAVYGDPSRSLRMLGVTGTNGKTTVAAMVAAGLSRASRRAGVIGTTGVRLGDRAFPGVRTTPEATDLQALLAIMRDAGADTVVMEVSSIAVAEHRVDAIHYDVMAFTNLSQDHLDYHGSMDDYFATKAAMFTPDHARVGIVGVDDEWGRTLASHASIPVQTWSATGIASDWAIDADGDRTVVRGPGGERVELRLRMPGAFNQANAGCAFAILRTAGVDADDAATGIDEAMVPGRMQLVGPIEGITGIVDYAHSPAAIERVLADLRAHSPGRVIAVVGAGGDRDRGKRPVMGGIAARLADVLVVTDDNPRAEDPAEIRRAILTGVQPGSRAEVHEEGDRRAAITVAVRMAEAGDVIVVLGKGHEQGQEAQGFVTPFDDATELAQALDRGAVR